MVTFRDFLARFRPTGAPGASATGVPADRAAELAAELGPSLDELTEAQEEAAAIRAAAAQEAENMRRTAARRAEEIVAEARHQAPQVREEAASAVRRPAEAEAGGLLAAADRVVTDARRRVAERMPALVDRAAAQALAQAEEPRRSR
ncbi:MULTISPECIES: hypothetical protein [unclassified Kitasatospora]|uniref:hypothetical protein n=1 Tax=unclassified Kitasatospora TaxID=2633591 RepID=UPI0033FFD478